MSEIKPRWSSLRAQRAAPLRGEFAPPGDRGLAARALLLGALAIGETRVAGLGDDADIGQLVASLRALGAEAELVEGTAHVNGLGIGGLLEPESPLGFGGNAAAAGLAMGMTGIYPFSTTIAGDPALAARDFTGILHPLEFIGIRAEAAEGRFLPATLRGPVTPVAMEVHLPRAAATAKGAVLFAALNCPGVTTVVEPVLTHAGTEVLLGAFGARVVTNDLPGGIRITELTGLPELRGHDVLVPADPGRAVYPLVAALIVPGSSLVLKNVLTTPTRLGLVLTLIEMGADITLSNRRELDGIEFADIHVRHSQLQGIEVPPERVPSTLRDYHLLALAAAFATGATIMPGLDSPEGEWDRLTELAEALSAAGSTSIRQPDRLIVNGNGRLRGGVSLRTHRDPALTATLLLMGMGARDPITIDDDSAASIAYPGFVELFRSLGVRFSRGGE